jgi:hypothetical protein
MVFLTLPARIALDRSEKCNGVRFPPSPPRHSSPPYQILRLQSIRLYDSKEKPIDSATNAVASSQAISVNRNIALSAIVTSRATQLHLADRMLRVRSLFAEGLLIPPFKSLQAALPPDPRKRVASRSSETVSLEEGTDRAQECFSYRRSGAHESNGEVAV